MTENIPTATAQAAPATAPTPVVTVETAPVMSVSEWFITYLLLMIPLVNLILLFVWAFGNNTNPNKKNFAKSALIWAAIGIVFYAVIIAYAVSTGISSSY